MVAPTRSSVPPLSTLTPPTTTVAVSRPPCSVTPLLITVVSETTPPLEIVTPLAITAEDRISWPPDEMVLDSTSPPGRTISWLPELTERPELTTPAEMVWVVIETYPARLGSPILA